MTDISDTDFNPQEESDNKNDNTIHSDTQERPKKRRSKHWIHFDVEKNANRVATCKYCHAEISFLSSITNLGRHIIRKHPEELQSDPLSRVKQPPRAPKPSRSSSDIWKHFVVFDEQRKVARCKKCQMYLRYLNFSNLTKHINRIHGGLKAKVNNSVDYDTPTPVGPIWVYFKCIDEAMSIAYCLICKKRYIYSEDYAELKRHLKKAHPNIDLEKDADVGKTFMVTDSGELYEMDVKELPAEADDETDASNDENGFGDYLDNEIFNDPESKIKPNSHTQPTFVSPKKLPNYNTTKMDEIKHKPAKVEEKEDSIDIFGKYIASLLKGLPKESSGRLQYEFVKKVFEEQTKMSQSEDNTQENISTMY